MTLKDLSFKDIYLGHLNAWMAGVPRESDPIPAPTECMKELAEIREMCDKYVSTSHKDEFVIRHNGISYRVSVLRSMSDVVYVLRRFPASVPEISNLGISWLCLEKLMQPNLSGLIVISGAFGQGKTTTASSLVSARLARYGGVAITIEDPPEMPLEGSHGEGICYQTWVDRGEFGEATRRTARYAPSIIFLGEVRDSETASEALRASINGRLIICTIHADSVPMAIERMHALANGVAGSSEDTASLLAGGLLCVLHQRLEGEPKRPKIEFLWLGDQDCHGVRSIIRQKRFEHIANEVTLQLNRMMMGQKIPTGFVHGKDKKNPPRI